MKIKNSDYFYMFVEGKCEMNFKMFIHLSQNLIPANNLLNTENEFWSYYEYSKVDFKFLRNRGRT